MEDYDDVLVTLLADVGRNYVEYRTLEQRLKLARDSVNLFGTMLRSAKGALRSRTRAIEFPTIWRRRIWQLPRHSSPSSRSSSGNRQTGCAFCSA